jgi:hypothetical protein
MNRFNMASRAERILDPRVRRLMAGEWPRRPLSSKRLAPL